MSGNATDPVTARLLASRVELLDLSLRNPLLNWRPSTRRGVEVVDEKAAQVFAGLVVERQSLRFHPTKASAPRLEAGADPQGLEAAEFEVGTGEQNPANSLATPYEKETLAQRLLATSADARLSLEEQGANILFLALGMLRWREAGSEDDRRAPLVLVPVRLDRKTVRAFWQLSATGEEPGVNLSLVEKLKEFGVRLPVDLEVETPEELEKALALFEQAAQGRAGWGVERDRIVLGFFSFGKFLMYRDLDPDLWPPDRRPPAHPVLAGLLAEGFRDRGDAAPAGASIDDWRPPGKTMEVMDCDSSQAEALGEVAAGRHLVVQGPPGTGKSQTISNLIAEAVFSGKKVLFVAEKMAALEVVKRRLDNAGLGELCLELHSNKTSKKDAAAELARTLAAGKPRETGAAPLVEELPARRDRLNRAAAAASRPVGRSGVTPFRAIGTLERLRALPAVELALLADCPEPDFVPARAEVGDLAAKIGEIGTPSRHPFEGCGIAQVLPGDEGKIAAAAAELRAAGEAARAAARGLASALCLEPAADARSLDSMASLAGLLLEAPDLSGLPPIGIAWDRREAADALSLAVENGRSLRAIREKGSPRLIAQAWDADLLAARGDLVACGGSWLSRLFSGRYRAAKARVQGLCTTPALKSREDLVWAADLVLEAQRRRAEIDRAAEGVNPLVGERWRGLESEWEALAAVREWALRFRAVALREQLPASLGERVVGPWDRAALRSLRDRAGEAAAWRASAAKVAALVSYPCDARGALADDPFASALGRAERWSAALGSLPSYAAWRRLHQAAVARGLADLAARAEDGSIAPAGLVPALDRARAKAVLDLAFRERPELRDFDATTHEQAVERFREADAATFPFNRERLALLHWRSVPGNAGYGQVGLLGRESQKKARHLPIRRLMEQAGQAVQAAKPVFLMSPLSIAVYLPPGGPRFDLVVFDEASQVKPVDAFGAILRGKQLVVVGDEKQMPPTSFFESLLGADARRDEEDDPTNVTQDLQSILGLCAARGMPSRMLRWHYRSRHDSLIALSNREFYGDELVVFPSPRRGVPGEGLEYRPLPATVYERGTSRTNPGEADAVVEEAVGHAKAHPGRSLGIVAFSQAQRDAIESRVEAARRRSPEFDAFARSNPEEPFFVKNLENVQGDERDAMLISVGYGRDESGSLTMNFGPLNQAGGERRLNVLITRARIRCAVFTNLSPDDLDLRRAPGEGVRALKAFLAFARDGRSGETAAAPRRHEPGLEAEVQAALEGAGHAVEAHVGSGGYRIDLAVRDPAAPGRYVIGIEFDGDRYHGARWARDRDRLRGAVLRGLGWNLHRVWSADWHRNREEALRRLLAAIEKAKAGGASVGPAAPAAAVKRGTEPPPGLGPVPLYDPVKAEADIGDRHLAEVNPEKLAEFAAAIVNRESPVHVEELRRRVLGAIDARPGSKRIAAIDEAVERAVARGLVRRKTDFLWGRQEREVVPRDRSSLPDASRDPALVAYEECRAAILRVVAESCGCSNEEAAVQAIRLLGVKRNDEAMARLQGLARTLAGEGTLARTPSGGLVPAR